MTAHLFHTEPADERLPLYEGKMIWHFDGMGMPALVTGLMKRPGESVSWVKGGQIRDSYLIIQQYRFAYRAITGQHE